MSLFVMVTGLTACQPLSTKRSQSQQSAPLAQKVSEHQPTTAADEPAAQTSSADSTQSPVRRKIPTLREQMEKLQTQQDVMNLRLDTVQSELRAIRTKVEDVPSNKVKEPKSADKEEPPTKGDSFRDFVNKDKQQKPSVSSKSDPKTDPKSNAKKTNIIMPDNAEADESDTAPATMPVPKKTISAPKPKKSSSGEIHPDNEVSPPKKHVTNKDNAIKSASTTPASSKSNVAAKTESKQTKSTAANPASKEPTSSSEKTQTPAKVETPNVLFTTAMTLFSKRQYQETIDLLTQLVAQDKSAENVARSQYWIGESYYGLGRYDDAIRTLKTVAAARNAEKSGKAELMIAESYIRLGNTADAKKTYQRILKQYPQTEESVRAAKRLQQL